jgi:hypothetical protein
MSDHLVQRNCLILNFKDCPDFVKTSLKNRESFRNDIYLEFISEFSPEDTEFWDTLTEEGIVEYWKEQTNENHYKGTLEQFITDYDLHVEKWILSLGFDLSIISKILLRVCW